MAFNLTCLRSNEIFEDALEYVCEHTEITNTDVANMNDVDVANAWYQLMAEHTVYHPNYDTESKEEFDAMVQELKSCFDLELTCFVLTNSNTEIHEMFNSVIYAAHPFTLAINAAKESALHSFKQKMPNDINEKFFDAFKSLNTPFNDERFTAQFLCTADNNGGYAFEEFSTGTAPGTVKRIKQDNAPVEQYETNAFNFYMDAMLGVLFFFKGKPSFLVSFNLDAEGNIYINQVQAQHKDRGNLKLGANWKEKAVQYIQSSLPIKNSYLIDGESISNLIFKKFSHRSAEHYDSTLKERIKNTYDSMFASCFNTVKAAGTKYRSIQHTNAA